MSHFPVHHGPESRHFADSDVYLTSDIPPLGGTIRQRPEDFIVEEVPLYQPAGEGEHVYLFVQKVNLTTDQLVRIIARHFRVSTRSIGFAGHKDRLAVTRQLISVHLPGRSIDEFGMIDHPRIDVLWADRHTNKLRKGHLRANRFSIRIRDVQATDAPRAARCLKVLESRGVPNRIGIQRFGSRHNNHLVGRELARARPDAAVKALLAPGADDDPHAEAWNLAAAGAFRQAAEKLPNSFRVERRVLEALGAGDSPAQAWERIAPSDRGFYLSAFQSAVFNLVLERRLADGTFDAALPGDLLCREDGRGLVSVDPDRPVDEQTASQVASFALTPSGPMWGGNMRRASGRVDQLETEALSAFGLVPTDLIDDARQEMSGGTRRPLRIGLGSPDVEGGIDEHGMYIRCAFDLPRGGFATEVLREIMKRPVDGG